MPRVVGLMQKAATLAGRELALVAAVLMVAGGLWGFVELTDEVIEGDTRAFELDGTPPGGLTARYELLVQGVTE